MVWGGLMGMTVVLLVLGGCRTLSLDYRAGRVPEEDRISIPENSEQEDVWRTREATVEYHYIRKGSDLRISGVMKLNEPITNNFSWIDYSHLDVIFVDAQGHVLEMRGLMSSCRGRPDAPEPFDLRLTLPPGTEAIAFSYRGKAYAGGGGDSGGDVYSFWYYPIHRW